MNWRIEPFDRPEARRLLLPSEMAAVDAWAIETAGVPALGLMENAARHVALAAAELAPHRGAVWILCGGGNNGADGLAAARHLAGWGWPVTVVLATAPSDLCAAGLVHLASLAHCDAAVVSFENAELFEQLGRPALVVDALLGTGQRGTPRASMAALIAAVSGLGVPLLAVDIPSGLCGTSGRVLGEAVRATRTVTFGASKLGHWLHPGPAFVGDLRVVDIGLPPGAIARASAVRWVLGDADLAAALAPLDGNAHKGRAGRVLVVGGQPGQTGAARLAAEAALRAGAGLVTIGTTDAAFVGLAPTLREVMATVLLPVALLARSALRVEGLAGTGPTFLETPSERARLTADARKAEAADEAVALAEDDLLRALAGTDAAVVGPGLPSSPALAEVLARVLPRVTAPLVIDAEALNLLVATPEALGAGGPRVLTPHPGEAGRLLGCSAAEVQADRLGAVSRLVARTGAVVVLKGAHTLVMAPDGRLGLCPDGNAGMATAGMGDALGGVIAALLARGLSAFEAAAAGVLWHARAGDEAAARRGQHGLNASDLIDALGAVERGGSCSND